MENNCEIHPNQAITHFCQVHKKAICVVCKEGHADCINTLELQDTNFDIKTSQLYLQLVENYRRTCNKMDSFKEHVGMNLQKLNREKVVFKNTLIHFRRKVEKHFDDLEEKLIKEYEKMYVKECKSLSKLEDDCKMQIIELKDHITELENLSSNVPESLTHLSKMNENFSNSENETEKFEPTKYEMVSIDFGMAREILTFHNITTLGTLSVLKTPMIRPLEREVTLSQIVESGLKLAEILDVQTVNEEIEIIDIKEMEIGHLVMTDRLSESVLTFDIAQNKTTVIAVGEYPDCIAVIDRSTVAVTQGRQNVIIVDVKLRKVLKSIFMEDRVEGIAMVQAKLVVNCRNKGLKIMSIFGNMMDTIPEVTGRLYLHAAGLDRIVCADQVNHTVKCFNMKGETLFSCSYNGLKEPYGITIDKAGNIFAAGMKSSIIYKILPDGSQGSRFLRQKDGVQHPYVAFWRKDGSFVLSNKKGRSVELFQYK